MAKGVYVGAPNFEPVTLPSGYTQLEYIQSSGTQYIDTNFKPDGETTVNIAFQTSSVPDNLNDTLPVYGTATDYNSNAFEFWTLSGGFATYGSQDYKSNLGITTGKKHTVSQAKNVLTVDGTSYTFTKQTFTAPYSLLLFATHRSGGIKICASAANLKIYSCEIYNNGTLVRNFIPAKNSGGTIGLYDLVNSAFYTNAGSGSFTAGATYAEVARKVSKIYLGIDNVAHKVKKGYIGIGGIARPFWSGGKLTYYGTITGFASGREYYAAESVDNYALFAGGIASDPVSTVEAYSKSLTKTNANSLSTPKNSLVATKISGYAIFGGGYSYKNLATVEVFDNYLTKTTPSTLSKGRSQLAAANNGNYALFGGGTSGSASNVVDAYSTSLTRSVPTGLTKSRQQLAATEIDGYVLFGGGIYSSANATVDTYNISLTKGTAANLSAARSELSATTVGNYALFAGGKASDSYSDVVDAYDKSLTRTTAASLSVARKKLAAATIGKFALFAGGNNVLNSAVVDVYDASLTHTISNSLNTARTNLDGTTVGNYAIFGGAYNITTVDAYTVA